MRRFAIICAALLLALVGCGRKTETPAPPKPLPPPPPKPLPEVLLRYHFVGLDKLASNTNAATFSAMTRLPASVALRNQTLGKLAKVLPVTLLSTNAATKTNEALLQPLLEDWLNAESFFELHGLTNEPTGWTIGTHLTAERAQFWSTNLWQLLTSTQTNAAAIPATNAWTVDVPALHKKYQFAQSGEWALLGLVSDVRLWQAALDKIKSGQQSDTISSNAFFEVDANLARLQPLLDLPRLDHLPKAGFTMTASGGYVRTSGKLDFDTKMDWPLQPWLIPTNTIRDPLLSFTALQGFEPWLKKQPGLNKLQLSSVPDQMFIWASDIAFQTSFTVPYASVSNHIEALATNLQTQLNPLLSTNKMGQIVYFTNFMSAQWEGGMPLLHPFLRPAPDADFLLGGVFPTPITGKTFPADLISQFNGRTNLLYYDWELTAARLDEWKKLWAFYTQVFYLARSTQTNAPSQVWLNDVGSHLGNTITEVTVTSPQELKWARKSDIGFTGVELVLLTHWLDNKNFPALKPFINGREAKVEKGPPLP